MKKLILSVIVILFAINLSARSSKESASNEMRTEITVKDHQVKGVVFDKSTNESLAGVAVLYNGQKVYTDLDGNFIIKNVGITQYEVKITMISYEDQTLVIDPLKETSLKIALNQQ